MYRENLNLLKIIQFGNPILSRIADPILNIDEKIINLANNMIFTMHTAPGIGLAAPQVNHSLRLITVDLSLGENQKDLIVLANPEILDKEGEHLQEEACLSVPIFAENVTRPFRCSVKGINLEGKEKIIDAEGLQARVFFHEIDHLDGKLFIDRLSPLKRNLIRKRLKKQLENRIS